MLRLNLDQCMRTFHAFPVGKNKSRDRISPEKGLVANMPDLWLVGCVSESSGYILRVRSRLRSLV
jgi:hypothetical protein